MIMRAEIYFKKMKFEVLLKSAFNRSLFISYD